MKLTIAEKIIINDCNNTEIKDILKFTILELIDNNQIELETKLADYENQEQMCYFVRKSKISDHNLKQHEEKIINYLASKEWISLIQLINKTAYFICAKFRLFSSDYRIERYIFRHLTENSILKKTIWIFNRHKLTPQGQEIRKKLNISNNLADYKTKLSSNAELTKLIDRYLDETYELVTYWGHDLHIRDNYPKLL